MKAQNSPEDVIPPFQQKSLLIFRFALVKLNLGGISLQTFSDVQYNEVFDRDLNQMHGQSSNIEIQDE